MSFYIYETQPKYVRQCDKCGKGMNEGYLYEAADYLYLCSSECLSKVIPSELTREYLFAEGYLFWTDWHDEVGCKSK